MQVRRIAPWGVACLTLAGVGFAATLDVVVPGHGDGALVVASWFTATLASSAVGLLLATRRGDNPIGWLLLANGLVLTAFAVATEYADYAVLAEPGALPGGEWAVLFNERAWPLLFVCVTAIAFVFPDGRLPSPAWRWVALGTGASFATVSVLSLSSPMSRARCPSCPGRSSASRSCSAVSGPWAVSWPARSPSRRGCAAHRVSSATSSSGLPTRLP